MTPEKWLNLAAASLLAFYVFYVAWEMHLGTLCAQIGVDYCDYWSAAKVANAYGYAKIYDLQLLDQVQKTVLPRTADPALAATVPFPYLPPYLLPFQALCLLSPVTGFWVWTAVKIAALIMYIRFFSLSLLQRVPSTRFVLMIFVSLPVFLCLFSGQVDIWLAICVGEFMRAQLRHEPFRAGLWLGGLLIKPQVLILIGLVLRLRGSYRILAGLAACGSVVATVSLAMIGGSGILQVLRLWLIYAGGQASNWIEGMMNWRMLGFHLAAIVSPGIGWGIAGAGMLATLIITILAWGRSRDLRSETSLSPVAVLGILAATTSFAWHSHIWTAMILLPAILYLYQAGILPPRAVDYWIFLPAILFLLVVFAPEALTKLNLGSDISTRSVYFLVGAGELGVNQYLLWWAVKRGAKAADS